ncbi:hypothetical protein FM104_05510 [Microbacterium esteraromaticum]|uniref:Uncharacterized protein n=1 Tax=Microbacterium esteraromaticum TaxID=57043 RepID=A0A1R4J5N4_9MICO|nr:IniB N-terminal domain-containing protein [Microbacterium esteraromaticum]SJN27319.1 hypothetical protein FM104_05510 [Microbacterium esteraromaticum]
MISPIETIADALVAFIMSLLRDPDAAEEFVAAPQAMLAGNGLQGVCMADVAAVRPVVVDHPRVVHHEHPRPPHDNPPPPPGDNGAVHEIVRMIQQFTTIDARSTVVDQSVNQNIWTEGGDVTQIFDQDAVVASGDHAIAAGDDVSVVDSDVDVSMGDVSIGNDTNTDSFNVTGEDAADGLAEDGVPAAVVDDAPADADAAAAAAAQAVGTAVDVASDVAQSAATPPPPPADVPEPADLLESDMTDTGVTDSYDTDAASTALNDQPVDAPIEDD